MNEKPEMTTKETFYILTCLIINIMGLGLMAYSVWTYLLGGELGVSFGVGMELIIIASVFLWLAHIECRKVHGDLLIQKEVEK